MPFGEQPPGQLHRRRSPRKSPRSRSTVPAFVQALGISGFLVGGIVYLGHEAMTQPIDAAMVSTTTASTTATSSAPTDDTCRTWSIDRVTVSVPDTKDGRTTWDLGADAPPDLRLALAVGTAPALESDTFRNSLHTTWRLATSVQANEGTPIELFADDIDGEHAERITGWRTTLPSSRAASSWEVGAARFELRCES